MNAILTYFFIFYHFTALSREPNCDRYHNAYERCEAKRIRAQENCEDDCSETQSNCEKRFLKRPNAYDRCGERGEHCSDRCAERYAGRDSYDYKAKVCNREYSAVENCESRVSVYRENKRRQEEAKRRAEQERIFQEKIAEERRIEQERKAKRRKMKEIRDRVRKEREAEERATDATVSFPKTQFNISLKSIANLLIVSGRPKFKDQVLLYTKTGRFAVRAKYKNLQVEYLVNIPAGSSQLKLPWGYEVWYNKKLLHSELFPPEKDAVQHDKLDVVINGEIYPVSFSLSRIPGTMQRVTIPRYVLENTPLFRQYRHHETLSLRRARIKRLRTTTISGAAVSLIAGVGLQSLALGAADDTNQITDPSESTQFQTSSSSARTRQNQALLSAAMGGALIGVSYYLIMHKAPAVEKAWSKSKEKLKRLKKQPISVQ